VYTAENLSEFIQWSHSFIILSCH